MNINIIFFIYSIIITIIIIIRIRYRRVPIRYIPGMIPV